MFRLPADQVCANCSWFAPNSDDPDDFGTCELATESAHAPIYIDSDDGRAVLMVSPSHLCAEYVEGPIE